MSTSVRVLRGGLTHNASRARGRVQKLQLSVSRHLSDLRFASSPNWPLLVPMQLPHIRQVATTCRLMQARAPQVCVCKSSQRPVQHPALRVPGVHSCKLHRTHWKGSESATVSSWPEMAPLLEPTQGTTSCLAFSSHDGMCQCFRTTATCIPQRPTPLASCDLPLRSRVCSVVIVAN